MMLVLFLACFCVQQVIATVVSGFGQAQPVLPKCLSSFVMLVLLPKLHVVSANLTYWATSAQLPVFAHLKNDVVEFFATLPHRSCRSVRARAASRCRLHWW